MFCRPTDLGLIAAAIRRGSEEENFAGVLLDDRFDDINSVIGAEGKGYYVDFPVLYRIFDRLEIVRKLEIDKVSMYHGELPAQWALPSSPHRPYPEDLPRRLWRRISHSPCFP